MKTSSLFILILTIANCTFAVLDAQEAINTPIFIQNLERNIVGNNRATISYTTSLGSGFSIETAVGTRSFETGAQVVAREQYAATHSGANHAAMNSHITAGFELKKTFPVNDRLKLAIYAGIENRIPIQSNTGLQLINTTSNQITVIPYTGISIDYNAPQSGTYNAAIQFNGGSLLQSGSPIAQPNSSTNIVTPSASPLSLKLGWKSRQ